MAVRPREGTADNHRRERPLLTIRDSARNESPTRDNGARDNVWVRGADAVSAAHVDDDDRRGPVTGATVVRGPSVPGIGGTRSEPLGGETKTVGYT